MNTQQQQPLSQQQKAPYFGAEAPQQEFASLGEWDMVQDMLSCAKALADAYSVQTLEGSCPQLRQIMMENWSQTVTDQYAIFQAMQNKGWYQVKNAEQQEVAQAKQTFTQVKSQLQ